MHFLEVFLETSCFLQQLVEMLHIPTNNSMN
jgi:hypothetical protein